MIVWPVVALVGFLVLTALVIAMGTRTTARYELEQQGTTGPAGRAMAADAVGAVTA
jgi:hypothetical protein